MEITITVELIISVVILPNLRRPQLKESFSSDDVIFQNQNQVAAAIC